MGRVDDWWRQAVHASITGIAFADLDGRLTYANPAWMRMFGYDQPAEVLGRHVSTFAESGDTAGEILTSIRARGIWTGETSVRRTSGETFVVAMSGTLLRDATGSPVGLMGSFVDLTERKRAEAARALSEEQYRSLVESAADPIFTCDPDGRYLFVNPAAAAKLGRTPDEVIGRSVDDLFPPEAAAMMHQGVRRVVETGEVLVTEERIDIQDQTSWYSNILQPIRNPSGRVEAVQGIVRDITRLKRTEEALRESEERLQQAIKVADIGIFDHDHVQGTIYRSPEHRAILGRTEDIVSDRELYADQGRPPAFLTFIHPDDREGVHDALRRAHHPDHGTFDVEFRLLNPDRGMRWIAMRAQTSFDGEGEARRPVRTIGATRDVTEQVQAAEERARLQDQLWQAQRMESIGRLAGGIAHDFNNMLTVINGQADLALSRLDAGHPLHATLQEVRKAGERSSELTRALLGFARQQATAPRVVDLNDLVSRSTATLGRLIGENVRLGWEPADGPASVRIDPTQVDQILINLAVNARDAIDDVGEVVIRTRKVALDGTSYRRHAGAAPGDYVVLEVADNGRGMDDQTRAQIFEPFYTTKTLGRGTGLGLATVYGIVRQNNGFIDVRSAPGHGTTLTVFLPAVAGETAATKGDAPASAMSRGTEAILVVEDQPLVLRLISRMLQAAGYTVVPANGPEEAIRLAGEHAGRFQLLVSDVVMPKMNGRDLAQLLMSRYPHLKCLLVSGHTQGIALLDQAGDELPFLPKPFTQAALTAKVREILDH